MADFPYLLLVSIISLLVVLLGSLICAGADQEREVYIVYMGSLPRNQIYTSSSHHVSLLQKVFGQSFSENLMVRSYNRSFNGFAVKLTHNEVEELSDMEDVVSVFLNRKYELLTTRSWDFLGLKETTSRNLPFESDIVIGVIDTGLWPELPSLSDRGLGPSPKKWKGACKGGINFTCNNKVIGARYYGSLNSSRDLQGHGSHIASIAAGVAVRDTSFYGLAQGTARGGAPSARIAAYSVCEPDGCDNANILAAFDDAIADGVDIISISLGAPSPVPLDQDVIAIGAFHAMERGIVTSHAAGNSGSQSGITASVAPWLISAAASTTDRRIITKAVLGNGKTYVGLSINTFSLNGTEFPLIDIDKNSSHKGKLVLGTALNDVAYEAASGAVGVIYELNTFNYDLSNLVPIPAVAVSSDDYSAILRYYSDKSKAPAGTILRSEAIKDPSAPMVASFSSRGPNSILEEIMKPDVSAPGIDILAGYSPTAPISADFAIDKRHVKYNILSGTSMSCPHVSGIAAYVKSFHPDWSPSAIQSAIMTTAIPMNVSANPDGEFGYGSGNVNPTKATQPGLVYEAFKEDYIRLLCRVGYDEKKLRMITGDNSTCPKASANDLLLDFNYPSLTAKVKQNTSFRLKFHRTATNVGQANSTYKATISPA